MIRTLLLSLCIAWPLAAANPQAVTLVTPSAMQYPFALAVDRFGNVYVADGGLMRISVWSPATRGMTVFLPLPIAPDGVTVDDSDNIYYTTEGGVFSVDATTHKVTQIYSVTFPNRPAALTVDPSHHVFVCFPHYHEVIRVDGPGGFLVPNQGRPESIVADRNGDLYFSDSNNASVLKWSASTQTITTVVSSPNLITPMGIAFDANGDLYLVDQRAQAIKKWSRATHQVTTIISGLDVPDGIAIDHRTGTIYFTEFAIPALKAIYPPAPDHRHSTRH